MYEWGKGDVAEVLSDLGELPLSNNSQFHSDGSDLISTDYIIDRLGRKADFTVSKLPIRNCSSCASIWLNEKFLTQSVFVFPASTTALLNWSFECANAPTMRF